MKAAFFTTGNLQTDCAQRMLLREEPGPKTLMHSTFWVGGVFLATVVFTLVDEHSGDTHSFLKAFPWYIVFISRIVWRFCCVGDGDTGVYIGVSLRILSYGFGCVLVL